MWRSATRGFLASILTLATGTACAAEGQFSLEASYKNAALAALSFDYREGKKQAIPGFIADSVRMPNSACYAKIPGSDNLTIFLKSIQDKALHREIEDSRRRMSDAVGRNKLEVWQEVICVVKDRPVPYSVTNQSNGGKWSSIPITLNGERQGAWNDVFTIVRPSHLYSVTVHPAASKP